jgi:hypothetical protein
MKESALAPGFMSDFEGFWAAILRESPLWGTETAETFSSRELEPRWKARRASAAGEQGKQP